MDEKLKAALVDKIKAAQEELKSPRAVKALLEDRARKTRIQTREKPTQIALYEAVRQKLLRAYRWKGVKDALARQGFAIFLRKLEKLQGAEAAKVELSAARAQQLALFPGFENLPTRIRSGSGFLKFPETTVAQFLSYETKYQARAVKNLQTGAELHRLAEKVQRYAETAPTMPLPEAFARAEAQAAKLHSVVKIG